MTSATKPKTVLVRGDGEAREAIAAGTILPGHLIALNTAGAVVVHPTAAGIKPSRYFAREEEYTNAYLETAYASGDSVPYWALKPGDQVYALVPANAPAIVIGDLLESNGDGTLRKVTAFLTDNSGGAANTTLVDVPGAYNEAALADNFADVAAAINALKGGSTGVARAIEAINNSANGAVARILVEIV